MRRLYTLAIAIMATVHPVFILAQTQPESRSNITPYAFVFTCERKKPFIEDHSGNRTQMTALLDRLKACSETGDIREVRVTAYSSIEGTWQDNDELTRQRAGNLRKSLEIEAGLDENLMVTNRVAEDWDGLAAYVDADARMPRAGDVNEIVLTTGIFSGREKKLMMLDGGRPYRYMKENYFPGLERVEVVIYCASE